ncbi:cation:proton antiporter [Kaistia algarum]|nr:cation:proton antiporter [Kaistia algarum]
MSDPAIVEPILTLVLLILLAIVTFGIVRVRGLFAVVILLGIYSFLMATLFVVLDAVDVAMTEASVGAGISTVLFLGALYLTDVKEATGKARHVAPLLVAAVTAGVLIWGLSDLPEFGSADQPIHAKGPDYLARSLPDTGIPNVVTSVLASYRGFDTLGETAVVFTAAIGVLALFARRRSERKG